MAEHSLGELQKLSQQALCYAELIEIARVHSPNQASTAALVRWPIRQAKATRFLAMVRRDYGQGAFDALISSSTEHARPDGSEHARGETMMSNALMNSLYPEGVSNVVFAYGSSRAFNLEDLEVEIIATDGSHSHVRWQAECTKLQLDEAGVKILARRIVDGMLQHWTKPEAPKLFYGMHWGVCAFVVRTLLSEEKDLYKKVLIAALIYLGGHAKYPVHFTNNLLPDIPESATIQHVIDYALANGCTEDEVMNAWGQMLDMREKGKFLTSHILLWCESSKDVWLTVNGKSLREVIEPIARKRLIYELNDILVQGCWDQRTNEISLDVLQYNISMIRKLASLPAYEWMRSTETQEQVEEMFISCFAAGRASTAVTMLSLFGRSFGLWSEYTVCLQRLLRGAQAKAEKDCQFGIASALAEHLGDTENADRLRSLARTQKQPITVSFGFNCPFKW